MLSLSQVVFAMAFDMTLGGRVLTPSTLLGFVLVLTPTAWITVHAGRLAPEPAAHA